MSKSFGDFLRAVAVTTACLSALADAPALVTARTASGIDLRLTCAEPASWTFQLDTVATGGVEEAVVTMRSATPAEPPEFRVDFGGVSGVGARHVWTPYSERYMMRPQDWGDFPYASSLANGSPVAAAFGNDANCLAVAASEALRPVDYALVVHANTCKLSGRFRFFGVREAARAEYAVRLWFDRRPVFWADAVREASDWIVRQAGCTPAAVPAQALEPVYSTWYAFDQDVTAARLEPEMRLAAAAGMRTAILDDGWQKATSRTFYSGTGDWMPVASRFPDMRRHVDAVHATGLKYMLWLALPFVGDESKAWNDFKDKFLFVHKGGTAVLDPRFPEVRAHLVAICERAVRDWDFDGLKLDFIDQFSFSCDDPDLAIPAEPGVDRAIAEGFAGRDIRELPQAVDRLMKDVLARVRAVKPDALIEFRQHYMGPAIRQYGNMIRAIDCPVDPNKNRKLIADLRLTSGTTAVHSDMLVWSPDETVEGAAQSVLSAIFGVVQYSMVLGRLSEEHRRMVRHWIAFSQAHRETLLFGAFRPHGPEQGYPLIEAESSRERIVAAYGPVRASVPVGALDKDVFILNATAVGDVVAELPQDATVETFDTCGRPVASQKVAKGLVKLAIPRSGYARVVRERK